MAKTASIPDGIKGSIESLAVSIDGHPIAMPAGSTALDALRAAGLEVPTVCHDPRLKPSGACRVCLIKVKGQNRPATSCALPLADGMEIEVDTPELREMRRGELELLSQSYPKELIAGLPEKPFHRLLEQEGLHETANGRSDPKTIDDSNPYFRFDPSACIECYRCVRICDEVQGSNVWQILDRGMGVRVAPDADRLSDSTCLSCGACSDTCPTGALVDKTRAERGAATKWTRTTCPYCGVGCELNVGTREQHIVQVLPVLDAPVNKGHLCVKGRYAHAFVHAPDRITEPMIRRTGEFMPVSWDEAIQFVADGFRKTVAKHGPKAVGVLGSARAPNEDNYMAQKFARVVLGTNNVDCCARVCHAPTAAAMKRVLGTGAATNSFDDIELARTILVAGSNSTECHPIVGERIIQAKRRGAKLIVIDPRRTDLARIADVHLQLHPGTNIPLLHSIGSAIVEEGLADQDFVSGRVDEFEEYVEFIRAYSPEAVATTTGVKAEDVRQAARIYAQAKPSMCFHGLGMTEHFQGTEGVMALVSLALLTGNIGKAGSGINPLRGQNNVQGSAHMGCEPKHLAGYAPIEDARERVESLLGLRLPSETGLTLMEMIDAAGEGRFKALWAIGYDVFFTNANAAATREAMARMDLVIVQDLFLTETAREFAHVFLPACSSFERDGTFMNAERRVQRVRAAMSPVGNARPDWIIIQSVAAALGHTKGFQFDSVEEVWEEVRQVWKPGAGMSYSRLEAEGLQWPCPSEDHPGSTILHQDAFPMGPKTKMPRIEFIPTAETVDSEFPFLLHTGRSLFHFNAGTMTMRTANADLRPTDRLDVHPKDFSALELSEGESVQLASRYGTTRITVHRSHDVRLGEVFATFHDPRTFVNLVTSPVRDRIVGAPEYKVCAIRIEKCSTRRQRFGPRVQCAIPYGADPSPKPAGGRFDALSRDA